MKFNLKHLPLILSLSFITLTITGAYGSWLYYTGGINDENSEIDVDIESFDYPEWTVNFYTISSSGKTLLDTYTYTYKDESWTFPSNVGTKYPEHTFKCWSPTQFYYEGNEKVYKLGDFTRVEREKLTGKVYYANQTYKPTDIDWLEGNVLNLFEITEEANFSIANDPELPPTVTCDSPSFATQHPNSQFPYDLPSYQPYVRFSAAVGKTQWDNGEHVSTFFVQFLDQGFETKSNPDKNELTISYTPTDNCIYQTAYRIIKEKPALTGYRVSEDPYRETGFTKVDGVDMVAYYEMNDPIVIYLTPGAYFTVNTGPTVKNPKKYRDYGGDNKHADDTFNHTIVPMLISCGDYPATNIRSFRENAFDASKYTVTKTIESDNSESESVTITEQKYLSLTVRWDYHYEYVVTECNNSDHSCLVKGTPILTKNGQYVPVEEIKAGDEVVVYNHETGKLDTAPITFNDFEPEHLYDVLTLKFSNHEEIEMVYEHGFFDLDLNKYVYLTNDNYLDYIGHRFYSLDNEVVTLVSGHVIERNVTLYSPVSYYHLNYFTGSLLSMPGGISGLFNIFEYEKDTLKYDEKLKVQDIEKYGLFAYEDFKDYATEEMFNAFPTPYLKVSIAKGLISMDQIMYLIDRYASKVN